jgi:hypothetical protein
MRSRDNTVGEDSVAHCGGVISMLVSLQCFPAGSNRCYGGFWTRTSDVD